MLLWETNAKKEKHLIIIMVCYNFYMSLIFIMNFFYLCILTQATIRCAFLRDKKVILLLLLILSGNPNRFKVQGSFIRHILNYTGYNQ